MLAVLVLKTFCRNCLLRQILLFHNLEKFAAVCCLGISAQLDPQLIIFWLAHLDYHANISYSQDCWPKKVRQLSVMLAFFKQFIDWFFSF